MPSFLHPSPSLRPLSSPFSRELTGYCGRIWMRVSVRRATRAVAYLGGNGEEGGGQFWIRVGATSTSGRPLLRRTWGRRGEPLFSAVPGARLRPAARVHVLHPPRGSEASFKSRIISAVGWGPLTAAHLQRSILWLPRLGRGHYISADSDAALQVLTPGSSHWRRLPARSSYFGRAVQRLAFGFIFRLFTSSSSSPRNPGSDGRRTVAKTQVINSSRSREAMRQLRFNSATRTERRWSCPVVLSRSMLHVVPSLAPNSSSAALELCVISWNGDHPGPRAGPHARGFWFDLITSR
ncbi:hypothetical protein DFH07DRAFT_1001341 [Mycena maculata]|uniref:Uncharacterized protein n=1 Tax=Mycena maculata TaxID=230809 RepID=A0AAD7JVD9_9AGAR|nr:hypothetical protein DFH07DRAFT_1001341 [Mycena maculata]